MALCVAGRVAAPYLMKYQINKTLAELPDGYSGHVDDVDLMLWRGGMALDGLEVYKASISKKVPLFAAKRLETSILWRSLLQGGIVGRALLVEPALEIVATSDADAVKEAKGAKEDAEKATEGALKPGSPVGDMIRLVPMRIDRFEARDGTMRFRKSDAKPPVDLHMDQVQMVMTNLTNSERLSDSLVARLEMTARAQDSGDFSLTLALNPLANPIDFDLRSKLMHLSAKSTNSFTKEYGKFDFEKGTMDLIVDVDVRNGYMKGYVKPLLHGIEISSEADSTRDKDNIFRRAWEAIVGAAEDVVENRGKVQSGTRIPIKGKLDAPGTDVFSAASAVLRNAYVRALTPSFEKDADGNDDAH